MLYVGMGLGWLDGWLSQVIGILRAPSVLKTNCCKYNCVPEPSHREFGIVDKILYCMWEVFHLEKVAIFKTCTAENQF